VERGPAKNRPFLPRPRIAGVERAIGDEKRQPGVIICRQFQQPSADDQDAKL
jgi:hypothetical protein